MSEIKEAEHEINGFTLWHWFTQPLGRLLLETELRCLKRILPGLFGYHIVQLGYICETNLLESSRISHKLVIHLDECQDIDRRVDCISSSESLALAPDTMDVIVMPHVLEFSRNPHKVLREIERALIGEGHLIIIGFNPWSLWGLWRLILTWYEQPPWSGHFYGLTRIKDWLRLLDFEIMRTERLFFRPPLKNRKIQGRLKFIEKLGRVCWPFMGGVYVILAKKHVIPLTPVKMKWRDRRQMIASGLAEPSTRVRNTII